MVAQVSHCTARYHWVGTDYVVTVGILGHTVHFVVEHCTIVGKGKVEPEPHTAEVGRNLVREGRNCLVAQSLGSDMMPWEMGHMSLVSFHTVEADQE